MALKQDLSDLDDYLEDYYDYEFQESALDIWNNCVILSVLSVIPTIFNLIILNFSFGCLLLTGLAPKALLHLFTGCVGIYLVLTLESYTGKLILLTCWIISYILLQISYYLKQYFNSSNTLKTTFILLLVLCEYYLVDPQTWLQIRGIVMVLVMKIISLIDDTDQNNPLPNIIQYFGYTLCGATVMFGPWISFHDYLNFIEKPNKMNLTWIWSIVQVVVTSLIFLSLSNCWSNYFITDDANRWLIAYKEAFTFRTSHYFVSYLAEVGMIASGFTNSKKSGINRFRYTITEPLEIEFPSSLSIVVKKWNQPMHDFLKKYIFRSWLSYGRFCAIFATFLISSFLHGLELKVSMVLISIGIFSYLQVAPRDRIADTFDCCVRVRPCKDCKHKYKRDKLRVKFVLFMYSLGTIFHLTYLGVLMDPSTDQVGIFEKWQHLYFASHILMFFNLLIIL